MRINTVGSLVFRRETAFKKPIMLPNRSVTRYAYSEVCSLLFVWLLWDLNRILTLNTLPPPIVLSCLLSGRLADVYWLIHLACGILILERLVFLAADWSGFPSLLFHFQRPPSLFEESADFARYAGRRSP